MIRRTHHGRYIFAQVKGKIATSALDGDSLSFLAYEYTLWNRSCGDPRHLDLSRSKEKFSRKLVGMYSFPFSFPFPTKVNLLDKNFSDTTAVTPFQDTMRQKQNSTIPSPTSPSLSLPESNGEKRQMSDLPNVHGISPFPYSPMPSPGHSSTAAVPESKGRWKRGSPSAPTRLSEGKPSRNSALPTNVPEKSPVHSSFHHQSESLGVDCSALAMPQTFFDKGVSASIGYELSIHFVHGRLKPATK